MAVSLADAETPAGVDFSCVVSEEGEVAWKTNMTNFEKLALLLSDDTLAYVKAEVLPVSGDAFPYLDPDAEWELYLLEEEVPAWFTQDMEDQVMAAFSEWKEAAYSKIDLEALKSIADPREVPAAEPAEEDIANLLDWIDTYNYVSACPRTATLDTIVSEVGTSLGHDAWNYVNETLWDELMEQANVNGVVRELTGQRAAGEKQESMPGAWGKSAWQRLRRLPRPEKT